MRKVDFHTQNCHDEDELYSPHTHCSIQPIGWLLLIRQVPVIGGYSKWSQAGDGSHSRLGRVAVLNDWG